ncbi:MAG: DUF370 domain-containing protein [Ruminococcaceae bacterium]|nr:DUF370 domain-containing protein [Oscillospiraceae bacterium]
MYITLGSSVSVKKRDVIGIFDLDTAPADSQVMEFLKENEKKKNVTVVGDGIPKAFVVTNDGKETRVYITTISASSIKGRNSNEYR